MANRALNRDLRALRKDLDELQDRLEDLGVVIVSVPPRHGANFSKVPENTA